MSENQEPEQTSVCPKCGAEVRYWQVRCRNCGEKLVEDTRPPERDYNIARGQSAESNLSGCQQRLCRAGLVCAIIFAGCFFFFSIFGAALSGEGLYILMGISLLSVNSVILVLCWNLSIRSKWLLIGGVLLTIEGLTAILLLIADPIVMLFLPLSVLTLTAGILLVFSWWKGRSRLVAR